MDSNYAKKIMRPRPEGEKKESKQDGGTYTTKELNVLVKRLDSK